MNDEKRLNLYVGLIEDELAACTERLEYVKIEIEFLKLYQETTRPAKLAQAESLKSRWSRNYKRMMGLGSRAEAAFDADDFDTQGLVDHAYSELKSHNDTLRNSSTLIEQELEDSNACLDENINERNLLEAAIVRLKEGLRKAEAKTGIYRD